ncbi:hypothetical protein RA264_27905, partial [Pseudomonas syringae pv. tagetis]|uniref:hypothetical protein n=1 Tax=Pseudomonas syringae group genomosp. 7 TaxID=251699 RepID=UPI00376F96D6
SPRVFLFLFFGGVPPPFLLSSSGCGSRLFVPRLHTPPLCLFVFFCAFCCGCWCCVLWGGCGVGVCCCVVFGFCGGVGGLVWVGWWMVWLRVGCGGFWGGVRLF